MNAVLKTPELDDDRYARCIAASKRIRFDIERDVFRGRDFDYQRAFLPDGLSRVSRLPFLSAADARFLSQVQGRSYAYIFGLVERFINAKVLELAQVHALGDQVKLEALVRFSDEELKHQLMFQMMETRMDRAMPAGYRRTADADEVARAVLSKSTWAVLALTCHIEVFTQVHYRESIEPAMPICPLWKDVFLFHWKEESQHAILDELEWEAEDQRLAKAARDAAVADLIDLVVAVDGILAVQAGADADYFLMHCERKYSAAEQQAVRELIRAAYRWQYIVSGVQLPRFQQALGSKIDAAQQQRVGAALAPLLAAVGE